MRTRLPTDRAGWTHKAVIHSREFGRVKLFVTANVNGDGQVKEVFITCDQPGAVLDGFCDAWATCLSMLLQWGESVETVHAKFSGMEFEPKGATDNQEIKFARSVPDYVVRWLMGVGGGVEGVKS